MQDLHENSSEVKTRYIVSDGMKYEYKLRSFKGRNVASFEIMLYEIYISLIADDNVSFYKTGGIFSNLEKATRFFNFLSDNLVTPIDAPYIVEDCICF